MLNPEAEVSVSDQNEREVFVGPRPFERSEHNLFFGRDREISELLSLVTSNRVVLCYAPSGAGKTSLINAGLHPRLETDGFEVLPSTRVRGLIPEGVDQSTITNIYVFNTILSLAKDTASPVEMAGYTISGYLSTLPHMTDEENFPSPRILIFDQFEELLTSYVERWQERDGFFLQVGNALQADPLLRVLFVMREDFLARMEPFIRILKPLSQARFRLDLLGPSGAHAAVTGPLRGTRRHFKDGVVDALVEELLKVRVESAHGEATEVVGEYVEPVQLQVVCRNLWNSLPEDVQEVSHEHLKAYGDVDHALRDFYESCLTGAKTNLRTNEADLRKWFERQLITPAGTRSIVFRDAQQTAGLSNAVVDFLENRHVIRGEWRAGSRWYELTHDRLIEPIQRANESWRSKRQARTSRLLTFAGGTAALVLILLAGLLSFRSGTSYAVPANSSVVAEITAAYEIATASFATLAVEAQSTTVAIQADASSSKSRQLAAEALLEDDRNLSLLLAIQANRSDDTAEARRSLHKVLSRQSYADGTFLRELRSDLIAPTLVSRMNDHRGAVVSVAFGPDGQRFVSGSANGTVLLWDAANAKPIGDSLNARGSGIESVAYSPDGRLVAFAGQDQKIYLWNVATGTLEGNPFTGHETLITCLAFSPDGRLLASGDLLHHLFIWETSTGSMVEELKDEHRIASLAWSPDGKTLAVGTFGSTVNFWKNEGGWVPGNGLYGLSNPVRSLAWSPNGKLLAVGLGSDTNSAAGGDVMLWDYENWKRISSLPDNTQRVMTVAFHPSGKFFAAGWEDGTIVFLNVERGQILGSPLKAHGNSAVTSIAFSPDGQYILSGGRDRTVALWNLSAPTSIVAVSPKGDLLATSQGPIISLWDLSTDLTEPTKVIRGHDRDILALAFSPDGRTLVSSARDFIIFWDVNTGQQTGGAINPSSNVQTLQFSPDGATIAGAGDTGRAQISNPLTGSVVYPLITREGPPVLKVQFSADGNSLDIAASDGKLTTFNLQSGTPSVAQERLLPSVQSRLTSIALSMDGNKAAYYSGATGILPIDGRAHGIDISYWDQSFDPNVNRDDVDFVIVKATEGTNYVDPLLDEYVRSIQSVPIRGAYHYFTDTQPWKEQADLFLSTVKDKGFHFYVLDLEVRPADGSTDFLAAAEQWLKYVDDQVDGPVLLGTISFYLTDFGDAGNWMKDWPLFVFQYPTTPDRNGNPSLPQSFRDWKMWNYTDKGNGPAYGVSADRIYLVVYNGTPAEMSQWLGLNTFSILDRTSNTVIHPRRPIQVTSSNGISFSPDGSYIAVADVDAVALLNPETGDEISTLPVNGRSVLGLSFTPDSKILAIGTEGGKVLLWDLSLLKEGVLVDPMLEVACLQVRENLSSEQWTQFVGADTPYQETCPNLPAP